MRTSEKVLVLKNNTKPITKIIKQGKRIQYQLKDDSIIYQGHIQQLQNDSFIINNNAVFLPKLKMIYGYFGLAGDLLGLIPFFVTTKIYDLEKDWSISIGNRQKSWFSLRKNKPDCCD
jgi:hypothetical protein